MMLISHFNMNFEQFWAIYPRKIAKFVARKSWRRLTKKEKSMIEDILPKQVLRWEIKEIQFIPHASTWLNQKRFEDELEQLPPKKISPDEKAEEERIARLREYKEAEKNIATQDEIREALGLKND